MITLKEHQIIPINFLKDHHGVILYHSTGSGKTLTALFAVYQFPNDIVIMGPKSSKKTFLDNIGKANLDPNRVSFYSYAKAKVILKTDIKLFYDKCVIVDEAHNLRSETIDNLYIVDALTLCHKVILLTATPVINYLSDMSVLVNVAKNQDVLPTDRRLFDQMYFDQETLQLERTEVLFRKLENCVSYYKNISNMDYPEVETHFMEVEMSPQQLNEYVYYVKKIIYDNKTELLPDMQLLNIDYAQLGNKKKNIFLTVTRQLSNTVNGVSSPKITEIYNMIKAGPYPIVVYSNYLKNGIYPIALLLEDDEITYETITGSTSIDKINFIVNNYNNNKYKVLLLSSAGSESLDLKKTRQVHIMEPHWNEARITQVIGRTVRYQSHVDLPLNERVVNVYRWISIFPDIIRNPSADQYLMEISERKKKVFEKFNELIIMASIENAKKLKGGDPYFYQKYLKYKTKYLKLKN